ncbi:MAG: 3-dehydroquinate synthase [Planctomycetes bacterium]|nr:3-dehydroquinate synthase [Planctomycetota bacterium]
MSIIRINLGARGYPIIIQNGLLDKIGTISARNLSRSKRNATLHARRFVIITDRNVATLYLNKVVSSLGKSGLKCLYYVIPAGEKQKSLATVNRIYNFLIQNKIERSDAIIALGGGVVGDIAGFVAGTYKRGIKLIQIPTSLLAQVDSSIGGKTGVNHPLGKNLIGMFYQPSAVLIDPLTIKTLPRREFSNGMAEVIKVAVIKDAQLFRLLLDNQQQIINMNPAILETIIMRAIMVKKALVEQDEYDTKDKRILLNYGHTIGHILESLGQYRNYKHGEAVAIGMMTAARIACRMGLIGKDFIGQQETILNAYRLPVRPREPIKLSRIAKFLEQDKKIIAGKITEILPNRIGLANAYQIPLNKFK